MGSVSASAGLAFSSFGTIGGEKRSDQMRACSGA
jgi:hypothetical protein